MKGTRRHFIKGSSLAAAALGLARPRNAAAARGTTVPPSDRVRFGVIGCNGMGWADMRSALRTECVECVALADGFNMLSEHATGIDGGNYGRTEGIAFIGNNGTAVVDRGGFELLPETTEVDGQRRYRVEARPPLRPRGVEALDLHTRNFVEAIRKNDASLLNCGIETGSIAAINAHMGNVAFKVGREVYWDPASSSFKNDAEANALVVKQYHNGWKWPTS